MYKYSCIMSLNHAFQVATSFLHSFSRDIMYFNQFINNCLYVVCVIFTSVSGRTDVEVDVTIGVVDNLDPDQLNSVSQCTSIPDYTGNVGNVNVWKQWFIFNDFFSMPKQPFCCTSLLAIKVFLK